MSGVPDTLLSLLPPGGMNIFLSSTVRDYRALRDQVREALTKKAQCACFPSEEWVTGYVGTIDECRDRVLQAGGFMLLLGHWYGSLPPKYDKSITHLEFEWAMEKRLRDPRFPMAVFRPLEGDDADKFLVAQAEPLLPSDANELALHTERLGRFHAQVDDKRQEWRTIIAFKDLQELRENAIVLGVQWRGITPQRASQTGVAPGVVADSTTASRLKEETLGALGREAQDAALSRLISRLAGSPEVPAMALVIYGDEDAGQRAFLARAAKHHLKKYHPKRPLGRLPLGSRTIPALVTWLAQTLSIPNPVGVETPEQLAEQVARELPHQPMYFAFDRINDLQGGLAAFQSGFWQPFWDRLKTLRPQFPTPNRLVAVVSDYAGTPATWGTAAPTPAAGVPLDYGRVLALPRLEPITDQQLLDWFETFEVPDDATGRRAALVQRALDDGTGNPDPAPLHVFERLRSETLWPDSNP